MKYIIIPQDLEKNRRLKLQVSFTSHVIFLGIFKILDVKKQVDKSRLSLANLILYKSKLILYTIHVSS